MLLLFCRATPLCAAAEGLELLCGPTGSEAAVRSYAIKCLFNTHPEKVGPVWVAECSCRSLSQLLCRQGLAVCYMILINLLAAAWV